MSDNANRLTPAEFDMVRQIAEVAAKAVAAETATLVTQRVLEEAAAGLALKVGEAAAKAARKAIEERLAQVAAFKGRR